MQDDQLRHLEFAAPSRMVPTPPERYTGDGAPVSFGQAVKRGLGRSTLYGRASRSEFWYFWLFATILNFGSFVVFDGMLDLAHVDNGITSLMSIFVTVVWVRRLHDVGKSGWWMLLPFTIIGIIPLFIWSVRKGDPYPNRFDLRRKAPVPDVVIDPSPTTAIDQLERLRKLHLTGAITDEEYRILKKRAL